MFGRATAKLSWNRLAHEVTYKSLREEPKLELTFKQKGNKFVIHNMVVLSNGYKPRDLQCKLQAINKMVNEKYGPCLK